MHRFTISFLLLLAFLPCYPLQLRAAQQASPIQGPLPHVSTDMEKPHFWTSKLRNPDRSLLNPREIRSMNAANLKQKDFYLCNVRELPEALTRGELLELLREDWEGFGPSDEIRYGKDGNPLGRTFWSRLKDTLNLEKIEETNPIQFGLIIKRTDIRVFPTDDVSLSTPSNVEFDRFQHSSISPGSLIGIYHLGKTGGWAYVQTKFIRGWVRLADIATAKERNVAVDYEGSKEQLVVTGNSINVYKEPLRTEPIFSAQMGASFPALSFSEASDRYYRVKIPSRKKDGQLVLGEAYIHRNEDVHRGFLPYTQRNVARQAFNMLNEPYGWGDMFGGRDCSRFIMDIFATLGIVMPRNSKYQAMVGENVWSGEGRDEKEKRDALDRAIPLATLLRLPGHIMLYLGKHQGRYYVIHSIWGIQRAGNSGPVVGKIARVVVSDLSLGESGPYGSLFQRITDIRFIGRPGAF
jgi:hypothetical protein